MSRGILLTTIAAAALASSGPALAGERPPLQTPPRPAPPQSLEMSDPLEGVNRTMFKADKKLTRWLNRRGFGTPVDAVPGPLRKGLYNVFSNLDEPVSFANQALQGKWKHAAGSAGRFVTNSTVGVLGTMDVATKIGLQKRREDFGQTLATYGVPAGPYIYLPLMGPSTVRDKLAGRVDGMARPLGWVDAGGVGDQAIGGVQSVVQPQNVSIRQRAAMAAEAGRTDDEYATLRDLYYAKRAAEIEDAAGADRAPEPQWRDREDRQYVQREVRQAPRQARAAPPRRPSYPAVHDRGYADRVAYQAAADADYDSGYWEPEDGGYWANDDGGWYEDED